MLNLTFSDRSLAKNGAGSAEPRPPTERWQDKRPRGAGRRSALTQEESTRYELSAINFHLGETSPRERKGSEPISVHEHFYYQISQLRETRTTTSVVGNI